MNPRHSISWRCDHCRHPRCNELGYCCACGRTQVKNLVRDSETGIVYYRGNGVLQELRDA